MSGARSAAALTAAPRGLRALAALAALAGVVACTSSSHTVAQGAAPATSAAVTTSVPPTAPPTTARPTTTTEALIPQVSPDVAARSLFDAWSKGDRVAALHVATATAVDALFGRPPASFSDRGCQDPISDRALCAFGVGGGLAQIGTVSLAGGWVVESVTLE